MEVSVFEDEVEEDVLADELNLELASLSSPSLSPPSPTQHPAPGPHHDWMFGLNLAWLARMLRDDRQGCREYGQGVHCLLQDADMQPP